MAIGASSYGVAWLVVMESLTLALLGGVVGALGTAAVSRLARSVLFGVAPQDPLTLAATAAILTAVAIAASSIPAYRATRVSVLEALRSE